MGDELILKMECEPIPIRPIASFAKKHFIMREILPIILFRSVVEWIPTQSALFYYYFSHFSYLW